MIGFTEILALLKYRVSSQKHRKDMPLLLYELFQNKPDKFSEQAKILSEIIKIKKELLKDNTIIEVRDFGTGGKSVGTVKRKIKSIARHSSSSEKLRLLQFNLVEKLQPSTILELGTSFGLTTSILAKANPHASVITIEGCESIAHIASRNFSKLGLNNIIQITDNFDEVLSDVLHKYSPIDYIFFDGNHRIAPTLNYFLKAVPHVSESAVFLFDDIRWSEQMKNAWSEILKHPSIRWSVDMFFAGLIFFDPKLERKEFKLLY